MIQGSAVINIEKVADIAKLAHIALTPEEQKSIAKDLQGIFQLVNQLENLCLQDIACPQNPSLLRSDDEINKASVSDILSNAPQSQHNFFVVPSIME